MGNAFGEIRDIDVLMKLFDQYLVSDSNSRSDVMCSLTAQRSARLVVTREVLTSARYEHMITELHQLSHHPHVGSWARMNPRQIFTPALWNTSCTLLYVVGEPTHRRRDVDLHQVRIATKKGRYVFEVASQCMPGELQHVAKSLKGMQEVLGQMNDRAVALKFLESLDLEEENSRDLQQDLRREVNELNPRWIAYFDEARQGFLDVFAL